MNKQSQTTAMAIQLQDDLKAEESAKKSAESSVTFLRRKLEEKQNQLENFKNPRTQKLIGKDFLASQKLAFTKKKKSVTPIKTVENSTPKIQSKRVKSLTRRIKRVL